jgi:hypothetical protein
LCAGIVPAFAAIGAGNLALWEAGRKSMRNLRALIRRMSVENVLWGAPHIHGELLKLGFAVAQSTVAKCATPARVRPKKTNSSGRGMSIVLKLTESARIMAA